MTWLRRWLASAGIVLLFSAPSWAQSGGLVFRNRNDTPTLVAPIDQMPMGIPPPPWGLDDIQAGPVTVVKGSGDSVSGTLAAGTVMSVTGSHGATTINANNCSLVAPCFIQGGIFTAELTVSAGHYLIFENIKAYNPLLIGDHLVIRHSEIEGDSESGGIFQAGSYLVLHHDYIHDVGTLVQPPGTDDVDRHCIPVQNHSHHIWILWNIITRCSGDAVQVSGAVTQTDVHHIYIGGNITTNNRQTGFWVKLASDVVISQNFCFHMRPSSGGQGDCIGSQYGANRTLILNNRIWDSNNGINIRQTDADMLTGTMIVGNVIFDTVHSDGKDPSADLQANGACMILMPSGEAPSKNLVYFNTCARVNGGVQVPQGATTYIGWNIINAAVLSIGKGSTTTMVIASNVFHPTATYFSTSGTNNIVGDPLFTSTTDFRLGGSSPAKAVGMDSLNDIYALMDGSTYMENHGIDLPSLGASPDAGAFTDLFLRGN